jgi:hypothetical protein
VQTNISQITRRAEGKESSINVLQKNTIKSFFKCAGNEIWLEGENPLNEADV